MKKQFVYPLDGTRMSMYKPINKKPMQKNTKAWIIILLGGLLAIFGEFNKFLLLEIMGFISWGFGMIQLFKKE